MVAKLEGGAGKSRRRDRAVALDSLPDLVLWLEPDGTILHVNDVAARSGWDVDHWIGRSVFALLHPDDVTMAIASIGTVLGKRAGTPIEVRVGHPEHGWRWFEVVGADGTEDPDVRAIVAVCRDITERRRWEVASGDAARFQAIVQHAATVAMLVDPTGRVESVSGAASRLLGLDPEALAGLPFETLAAPGFEGTLRRGLAAARDSAPVYVECPVRHEGATGPTPYRFELVNLCVDPVVRGYVVTGHDITELDAVRTALRRTADHDPLTGLPNRHRFAEHLRRHVPPRPDRGVVGVVFVDIDNFQSINDLVGHDAGDELLRSLARRLSEGLRTSDIVARIGGDEFGIVVPGMPDARSLRELVARIDGMCRAPLWVPGPGHVSITASVGIALADTQSTVESVFAEGERDMRRVKHGRPRLGLEGGGDRRALARALVGALGTDEIEAWFQPVVAIEDRALLGYEALARWRQPSGTVRGPAEFLGIAQELGLMTALDLAVVDRACAQLVALHPGSDGPWVSVNLTAVDLADPRLPRALDDIIERRGLRPDRLVLEVTEHSMLERYHTTSATDPVSVLNDLSRAGFPIVLDDFGTGYSSLTHVRSLDLHALKIDRSFISRIDDSPRDRSVVGAVIGLAKALGLRTVAEGVETRPQLDIVAALGCDAVQGFLVLPPRPVDAIARHLDLGTGVAVWTNPAPPPD